MEVAKPRISSKNDVLVKTIEVGLDGTDFEVIYEPKSKKRGVPQRMILGHEAVGVVEQIGSNVSEFEVGDFVVPTVRRPCKVKSCLPCRHGESDMCTTGLYQERGIKDLNGFMSDYFIEKSAYLIKIPIKIKEVAVLIEPLSIVEKTIEHIYKIQERLRWSPKSALILGAGPLGILFSMYFRWKGLDTFVYSRNTVDSIKSKLIGEIGANYIYSKDNTLKKLITKTGNFDIIIEATGSSELAFSAMDILGTNGVLTLISVTGGNKIIEISSDRLNLEFVLGNKLLFGSVNSNIRHFEKAKDNICNIKEWQTNLKKMITSVYSVDGFKSAFDRTHSDRIKTIIKF